MSLRRAAPLAMAGLFVAAAVGAQSLPRLDPEAMCRTRWTRGGALDHSMFSFCMRQEQSAYDGLVARWGNLPLEVQQTCDRRWGRGASSRGSYQMLEFCVDQQMQARSSQQPFRF